MNEVLCLLSVFMLSHHSVCLEQTDNVTMHQSRLQSTFIVLMSANLRSSQGQMSVLMNFGSVLLLCLVMKQHNCRLKTNTLISVRGQMIHFSTKLLIADAHEPTQVHDSNVLSSF